MRRWKKEMKDRCVIIELLNTCHVGRLGTIGKDSYPMVKPLNFAYNPPCPPLVKGGRGDLERFISIVQRREREYKWGQPLKLDNST